jgi:transposase
MAMTEVFMSNRQYTAEFKAEAVKQVLDRGFTVVDVAARLGLPKHTLYEWVNKAKKAAGSAQDGSATAPSDSAEVRRLKAELKRVTEERDILKKAAAYFAKG